MTVFALSLPRLSLHIVAQATNFETPNLITVVFKDFPRARSKVLDVRAAVIGAGIAGASVARFLSGRGHQVTIFEQFEPGHSRGSSHGNSRIVRRAYPDAFYTGVMMEAYPLWGELERLSGQDLLHECGLLYFGPGSDPNVREVAAGLRANGVPHEVLDPASAAKALPGLKLEPEEVGVLTPEAGWVRATECVLESLRLAEAGGAVVRRVRVEALSQVESEFDAVALCAGPWISRFLDVDVRVTSQTYAYVSGRHTGPVWIEEGPNYAYGFPSEQGRDSWKVGAHNVRVPVDPEEATRPISAETLAATLEFARRRFGDAEARIVESATCLYTLTENEDFLIGRVSDKTVFASACSGHGFKFGPWVGKTLAGMMEGGTGAERFPRFWSTPRRLN
jgi:sarcosine oxidase